MHVMVARHQLLRRISFVVRLRIAVNVRNDTPRKRRAMHAFKSQLRLALYELCEEGQPSRK
jgi:hypothetical protein